MGGELALTSRMEGFVSETSAVMDKYDPRRRSPCMSMNGASWYDQEPGSKEGFLYQQNSLRDAQVAALTPQHLPPPYRPGEDGEHRPDGECAAGDDPDRWGTGCC